MVSLTFSTPFEISYKICYKCNPLIYTFHLYSGNETVLMVINLTSLRLCKLNHKKYSKFRGRLFSILVFVRFMDLIVNVTIYQENI